nr:unnamed protein product [Callosobruchus chinensis]
MQSRKGQFDSSVTLS